MPPPTIQQKIREGDEVLVQVLKDPIGTKGARVSGFLSVSSRNLVFMAHSEHIGVSNKIASQSLRDELKKNLGGRSKERVKHGFEANDGRIHYSNGCRGFC